MMNSNKPNFGRLLFEDQPLGSAFLCHNNNLVATCYHILEQAFGSVDEGQVLTFEFLPGGYQTSARVTKLQDRENDIVVLELTEPDHDFMATSLVKTLDISPGTAFSTMGYGHFDSERQHRYMSATGTIAGWMGYENRKLLQLKSSDILDGLSGAPIYVEGQGIVGILTGRYESDPGKTSFGEHIAYAVPIHHLIALLEHTSRPEFVHSGKGVFISYKSEDREEVRKYYDEFRLRGVYRVWMDQKALIAGDIWRDEIAEAITTRSVLIVFVTPKALASEEVKKEYILALEKGLQVIPVILADCSPEILREKAPELANRHVLNVLKVGMQTVVEELCRLLPRSPYIWDNQDMCHVPDVGICKLGEPNHAAEMQLDEFWISKHVVTANEYLCFVKGGGYKNEEFWLGNTRVDWGRSGQYIWIEEKFEAYATTHPDFPMSQVTWYEAMAYARWFSYQTFHEFTLPDKWQWEKAARGNEGLLYPWGRWKEGIANTKELGQNRVLRCGELGDEGNSPYGCQDMAGNVWEWTRSSAVTRGDETDQYHIPRVIKGGSYRQRRGQACAYFEMHQFPVPQSTDVQDAVGFRLITTANPSHIRKPHLE
jgi:formylglycine-generating enzyme required for sulfatase activity